MDSCSCEDSLSPQELGGVAIRTEYRQQSVNQYLKGLDLDVLTSQIKVLGDHYIDDFSVIQL